MTAPDLTVTPAVEVRSASAPFVLFFGLAQLAAYVAFMPLLSILLPLKVQTIDPAHKLWVLGLLTGIGAIVAVVANPIVGRLSDRTHSRWGRRKPWIVVGTLLTAASYLLLLHANTFATLLLGLCLFQLCFNLMFAPLQATVPDCIPDRQKGAISGLIGIGAPLAGLIGAQLIGYVLHTETSRYAAIAAIVLAGVLPFAFVLREAPSHPRKDEARSLSHALRSFWLDPRTYPDFAVAWVSRFLIMLGYCMVNGYMFYFIQDGLRFGAIHPGHTAVQAMAELAGVALFTKVPASLLGGWLSDRVGRRKPFVVFAGIGMGLAMAMLAAFPLWPAVLFAYGIMGVGVGAFFAVDFALVAQVLPSGDDAGKDLGIFNLANTLPQFLGPFLAGPLVVWTGTFAWLFSVTAVVSLLGAVSVLFIRKVK